MKRLFITATAVGLAFGGSAFAQSTMDAMDMTCSEFMAASESDQSDVVMSVQEHMSGMGSDATGSAAETESDAAINSGADVSAGTRGTDQSGTAALTAESAAKGEPAGTVPSEVSASDVMMGCQASPDMSVSEVVKHEMME